ncbi:hypothetical protein psal_cds_1199 [Pandoravirus salinus]|uniref:Uncharacterized protein n=1 Tax=Pandoravirus salinus TaxID=1349410 RepID=S4W594_9VIRU|nr:hypothetical protein psal_cds_1199 [Pandoravirus salinus]AGO85495.2 hypothetical protein psal_cds_1199 [Pandoravirus salinus]
MDVDDYVQPADLLPPSPALLERVRDELGPWRNHSAIHAIIVDVDEQGLVRVAFEVFPAVAAKSDLPKALWLGALRGCRVIVHHRAAPDDAIWAPTSMRVLDQRCRSASASPSTPRQRQSPLTAMATPLIALDDPTGTSGGLASPLVAARVTDGDIKVEPAGAVPIPTHPQ